MKAITVLFLVGLSGMIFGDIQPADAKTIPTTGDISNTRSYQKITSILTSVEAEVKRDIVTLTSKMSKDERTSSTYKRRVTSYTKSMRRFKLHLKNAQTSYDKYNAEYRKKINENRILLQSLARQRVFIRQERKYIDHMEREALSLKKYSKQYIIIRREIRQMRVQVNKEIQDVERAYRIAKSKIIAERNVAKSRRSSESSKTTSYESMVTRYETLTRTYTGLLTKLGTQQSGNLKLKKELQDQLDLLQEIRMILATFKPGQDTDNKYQVKYEKCVEDFRVFRNKYQNMNCTAL
jgi:chromosome segregation ATPase